MSKKTTRVLSLTKSEVRPIDNTTQQQLSFSFTLPTAVKEQINAMFLQSAQATFKQLEQRTSYPEYMDKKTASKYMGVSVNTFNSFILDGLPIIQTNSVTRIKKSDCDNYYTKYRQ